MKIKRGEIYWTNGLTFTGSQQGGNRPVLVIQNDTGNKFSPSVIVACITCKPKKSLSTHVDIFNNKLVENSMVLLEQVKTIDKTELSNFVCKLDKSTMHKVNTALKVSLGVC